MKMIYFWIVLMLNLSFLVLGKRVNKLPPFNPSPVDEIKGYTTIAILGTNDIHGALYERNLTFKGEDYQVGGFKLLSAVVDMFRTEYKDRFLWLDAGDEYQGTYENSISEGNFTQQLFMTLKPDTATLGNHEWDWKEKWLRNKMSKVKNFQFVVANLQPKGNTEDLPNKIASKLFTFKTYNISIGVIGLLTKETPTTTSGFPQDHFTIIEYRDAIKTEVPKLRNAGANAILLLTHVGSLCLETQDALRRYGLRTCQTVQKPCPKGEMAELLSQLEKDSGIDAVIAGHEHAVIHHCLSNIPVIQNPMSNMFTHVLYLRFDSKTKKLDTTLTTIEGPIPLCSKVFSFNNRCDMYVPETGKESLINIQLHGRNLIPNKQIVKAFDEFTYKKEVENALKDEVAVSTIRLSKTKDGDSSFGIIISDMIKNETKADVAICAFGGIRSELEPGKITRYDLLKVFPFESQIASMNVTGRQLKGILTILQEGAKGFYAISGVTMKIELDGIKKKVVSIKRVDGSENGSDIEDAKTYILGSYDFLLNGGDDFGTIYKDGVLPTTHKNEIKYHGSMRDKISAKLNGLKTITAEHLPKKPRLNIKIVKKR